MGLTPEQRDAVKRMAAEAKRIAKENERLQQAGIDRQRRLFGRPKRRDTDK